MADLTRPTRRDPAPPAADRYDRRWWARPGPSRLLLAGLVLVILLGLRPGPAPRSVAAAPSQGDAALYRAVDRRLAQGQGYYAATAAEQRRRGYPLRPFVTVRSPARAWLFRWLGPAGALWLLRLLAVAAVAATTVRLRGLGRSRAVWIAAALLVALSATAVASPVVALWPEAWAGLLVALCLGCRGERRWGASVGFGLAAALFRELAMPVLPAMAWAAWADGRRREAAAWLAAMGLAGASLAAHAAAVRSVLRPGDPASQGWVRIGGWGFDLAMARATTPLFLLPPAVTAVLAPLAVFGWIAGGDGYSRRVALALLVWLLPFLVIGRSENSYWGLLLAPLWLGGLPLAAPALRDTLRHAFPMTGRH